MNKGPPPGDEMSAGAGPTCVDGCPAQGRAGGYRVGAVRTGRNAAVRDGEKIHTAKDGTKYEMSLTRTCLKCHSDREAFCDRCHDYADVHVYCWDCHVDPEGK